LLLLRGYVRDHEAIMDRATAAKDVTAMETEAEELDALNDEVARLDKRIVDLVCGPTWDAPRLPSVGGGHGSGGSDDAAAEVEGASAGAAPRDENEPTRKRARVRNKYEGVVDLTEEQQQEKRRLKEKARRNREYKLPSVQRRAKEYDARWEDMTARERRKVVTEMEGKRGALRRVALTRAMDGEAPVADEATDAELRDPERATQITNINKHVHDRLQQGMDDARVSFPFEENEETGEMTYVYDERWEVPPLGRDFAELYEDDVNKLLFERLARKFGRTLMTPNDARLRTSCETTLCYKKEPKVCKGGRVAKVRARDVLTCEVCRNRVWNAYVERATTGGTRKRAHLACALWFANSKVAGEESDAEDGAAV